MTAGETMSDLYVIEDLDDLDADGRRFSRPIPRRASDAEILSAALALEGVETVSWCEVHQHLSTGYTERDIAFSISQPLPCRIVDRAIIPDSLSRGDRRRVSA